MPFSKAIHETPAMRMWVRRVPRRAPWIALDLLPYWRLGSSDPKPPTWRQTLVATCWQRAGNVQRRLWVVFHSFWLRFATFESIDINGLGFRL